jgi:hypothetical protein
MRPTGVRSGEQMTMSLLMAMDFTLLTWRHIVKYLF